MKRARTEKPVQVICFTRRTDGVGNPSMLAAFLKGLEEGRIRYAHPRFALNKGNERFCEVSVEKDAVISWWSKDYAPLLACWEEHKDVLNRFGHHFSFTINGPSNSPLEPGIRASLKTRIDGQLPLLYQRCIFLNQDPDKSIMVHLDPIVTWKQADAGDEVFDNLDHVEFLCDRLASLGLTRMHTSFMQFFPMVKSRLKKMQHMITILDPTDDEKRELVAKKLFPHATRDGIRLQTCSNVGMGIPRGSCVGWSDVASITGGKALPMFSDPKIKNARSASGCTCYPHRDVGDKTLPCIHGCRYCFSHPASYPQMIPDIETY